MFIFLPPLQQFTISELCRHKRGPDLHVVLHIRVVTARGTRLGERTGPMGFLLSSIVGGPLTQHTATPLGGSSESLMIYCIVTVGMWLEEQTSTITALFTASHLLFDIQSTLCFFYFYETIFIFYQSLLKRSMLKQCLFWFCIILDPSISKSNHFSQVKMCQVGQIV